MKKYTNEELNIISGGKDLSPDCISALWGISPYCRKKFEKDQTEIKPLKEEIKSFGELKNGGLGVNIAAGVVAVGWFAAVLELLKEVVEHQNIDLK